MFRHCNSPINNWTIYVNVWRPTKHWHICFEMLSSKEIHVRSKHVCISRNWQEKSRKTARVDGDLIWILHPVLFLAGTGHPSVNKSLRPKGPGTRTRRIGHVATSSFQETICVSTEPRSFSARNHHLPAGHRSSFSTSASKTDAFNDKKKKKEKRKKTLRDDLVTPSRIDLLSPLVVCLVRDVMFRVHDIVRFWCKKEKGERGETR